MVELLDLKTVLLAFGEFGEYIQNRTKGSHIFLYRENLYLSKDKIVSKKSESVSKNGYYRLFQINDSKIYLICSAVGTDVSELGNTVPLEAFYSDSYIDAVHQLNIAVSKKLEKVKK